MSADTATPVIQSGLEALVRAAGNARVIAGAEAALPGVVHREDGAAALQYAASLAIQGQRAIAILSSAELERSLRTLERAVRDRVPVVAIVVTDRDWTPLLDAGAHGSIVLAASTPDTAVPLLFAAQQSAESALLPALLAVDQTTITAALSARESTDLAPLPDRRRPANESQRLLLGGERDAVPAWLDPGRPLGIGLRDDGITAAASRDGLDGDVEALVDSALAFAGDAYGIPIPAFSVSKGKGPILIGVGPTADALTTVRAKRLRTATVTRLAPFPVQEVRSAELTGPTALLAPASTSREWEHLAEACSVPLGICPVAPRLLKGDLLETARFISQATVPDLFFVGAHRGADRAPLPETERRRQKIEAAYPDLRDRLVDGGEAQEADALIAISGEDAQRVVMSILATEPLFAAAFHNKDGRCWLIASKPSGLTVARAARAAASSGAIGALTGALVSGSEITVCGEEPCWSPALMEHLRGARVRPAGTRLIEATVAALAGKWKPDQLQKLVNSYLTSALAAGMYSESEAWGMQPEIPTTRAGAPFEVGDISIPSPVLAQGTADESIFDPAHFWRSIGYLYHAGRESESYPDPGRTIAALPAGTGSTFARNGIPHRIPRLQPNSCTACGICWSACPEGAVVARTTHSAVLVDGLFAKLKEAGGSAFQLERLKANWAKEVDRLLHDTVPGAPRSLDVLLSEGLEQLVGRAKLADDRASTLRDDFGSLESFVSPVAMVPVDGGPDLAFSVDPDRCTACGICVAGCPESALSEAIYDASEARASRDLLSPVLSELRDEHPSCRLLSRHAERIASAGPWDSGVQAAFRVVAAIGDAHQRSRASALADHALGLAAQLQKTAQATITKAVTVKDFSTFKDRIGDLEKDATPESLLRAASTDLDALQLASIKSLAEAHEDLSKLAETFSDRRANVIAILDEDSPSLPRPEYPNNPFSVPWLYASGDALAETALAVVEGQQQKALKTAERIAAAEAVSSGKDSLPASADWIEAATPQVLVVSDRLSSGLTKLLLQPDSRVRVLIVANSALSELNEVGLQAIALGSAFVAQCTLDDPDRLVGALQAGFGYEGPSLLHILAPAAADANLVARSRDAVLSRTFPVFKFEPSKNDTNSLIGDLDLAGNPREAVSDPLIWSLQDPTIQAMLMEAGEAPDGALDTQSALATDERCTAYLELEGKRYRVPDHLLGNARRKLRVFDRLRRLAPPLPPMATDPEPVQTAPPSAPAPAVPIDALERLTSRLLELSGFGASASAVDEEAN